MSKGVLDPMFTKNDNGSAEEYKAKWVSYEADNTLQVLVEPKQKSVCEHYIACLLELYSTENPQEEEEEFTDYKKRLLKEAVRICQQERKMCHYRRIVNMVQHVLCVNSPNIAFKKCLTMI